MDFVEKLLSDAAARGDFDDLPGSGRPLRIHDSDPGWWGRREAERIRRQDVGADAIAEVEAALGRVWRVRSETAVRSRVDELNRRLRDAGVIDVELDVEEVIASWRRMARLR